MFCEEQCEQQSEHVGSGTCDLLAIFLLDELNRHLFLTRVTLDDGLLRTFGTFELRGEYS